MSHLSFALTADGSKTIFNEKVGEHYHSRHGAVQESKHVFLNKGLQYLLDLNNTKNAHILEVGFGTGLNFLVTADFCTEHQIELSYTGIEAYPLKSEMICETGYNEYVLEGLWHTFINQYEEALNQEVQINPNCKLQIEALKMLDFNSERLFDLIYFDAFAAAHQPEMWDLESLKHISQYLKQGGVFVTYAITGNLKRAMKSLGFRIEKVPGAPGKHEMLRAVKMQ